MVSTGRAHACFETQRHRQAASSCLRTPLPLPPLPLQSEHAHAQTQTAAYQPALTQHAYGEAGNDAWPLRDDGLETAVGDGDVWAWTDDSLEPPARLVTARTGDDVLFWGEGS